MEIRFALQIMARGKKRSFLLQAFESVLEKLESRIASFDASAAFQAADLMEARRRTGRPGDLRDTMITGIALANQGALATRNVAHFKDLDVPVVDPWSA